MITPLIGAAVLGNEPRFDHEGRPWSPYKAAKALGCDFVRLRIVYPYPLEWAWSDAAIAEAEQYDLKVQLIFWIGTGSSDPRRGVSRGIDDAQYATACRAIAERYRGRVWSYALENEPDEVLLPREYVARVAAGVPAIHAGDPAALVLAGELASEMQMRPWAEAWLVSQALTNIWPDVFSIHAYDGFRNQWPGIYPGVRTKTAWAESLIRGISGRDIPVMVTEAGGYSAGPPDIWTGHTPPLQAAITARVLHEAHLDPLPAALAWYRLADQADGEEEQKWGLFSAGTEPEPRAYAKPAAGRWAKELWQARLGMISLGVDLGPDRIGKLR